MLSELALPPQHYAYFTGFVCSFFLSLSLSLFGRSGVSFHPSPPLYSIAEPDGGGDETARSRVRSGRILLLSFQFTYTRFATTANMAHK
jgi:hypothetical protein